MIELGAEIADIAKAKGIGYLLGQALNAEPDYDITDDYVKIHWGNHNLSVAQDTFKKWVNEDPGPVRVDLSNVVTPALLEKYWVYGAAMLGIGYLLGRK